MLHEITKDGYSATIDSLGAELTSFTDDGGEEYMWSGDSDFWKGSAPILFPVVGRLRGKQYSYENKMYKMAKHGFARTSEFARLSRGKSETSFVLRSNPETESIYPFKFEFEVKFRIDKKRLRVYYRVKNTGRGVMPFTLGSHPAFALPVDNGDLEDYYLEFEKNETLDLYFLEDGLLCREPKRAYMNDEKIIRITKQLFDDDALIFKNIQSRNISIHHDKKGRRLTLDTGGAPHLGIWAKPGAPFVCLEPWYSHDDEAREDYDIMNKTGIITLDAGEEFTAGYEIRA